VVLSSRGRGRGSAGGLLGSVADHVLRHVGSATIMVVPPDEAME
jgi:nucleotide-binding universal stress UspA family protein